MKKIIFALAAFWAATAADTPADAAVITKAYVFNATFDAGPLASVTSRFTLSFDPAVFGSLLVLSNASTGGPAYTVPASGTNGRGFVVLGGAINGPGMVVSGTDDFAISFITGVAGDQPGGASSFYSLRGEDRTFFSSTAVIAEEVPAVPEPAGWAMMLAGLGTVGLALRRRQRARVRFA